MLASSGHDPDLADAHRLLLDRHAGYWAEQILGFKNEPHHDEWYEAEILHPRLGVVAPREFAKSEVFSVITTGHHAQWPGYWQYLFSDTRDQAKELAARVVTVVADARPDLVETMWKDEETDKIFANFSRITVAGKGKKIRGAHPDRIVGDDILSDESTNTAYMRRKDKKWWHGVVANMAHPPLWRRIGWGKIQPKKLRAIFVPATTITLTGTPFHMDDLLMSTRDNPLYHYRRYEAISRREDLVPGSVAVEIGEGRWLLSGSNRVARQPR